MNRGFSRKSLFARTFFAFAFQLLVVSPLIVVGQGTSSFQPINSLKLSPVESFSPPNEEKPSTTGLTGPVVGALDGKQETVLPNSPVPALPEKPQDTSNKVSTPKLDNQSGGETIIEDLPLPNRTEARVTVEPEYLTEDSEIISEIPEDQKDQRDLLLQAARNAVGLMDMELAIERFENLLSEIPKDDEARFEYAGVLSQVERLEESIANIEILLPRHAKNPRVLELLVSNFMRMESYADAATILRSRYEEDLSNTSVALRLTQALLLSGQRSAAIQAFVNINRENITGKEQTELAGEIFFELNNPREVTKLLTPYLLDGTLSEKSISLLIRSAAKGDEVELVGQATNRYLVLNPEGLDELIEIGNQLLYEGSGAASVAVFKILHDRTVGKTDNQQVILGLANSLARQFRFEESTRLLDTHRERINSLASDLIIARGYQDMGHPFEAIALVDNILAHNPDDIDAIIIKAKSHADVGQYDLAESLLLQMAHKYPDNNDVKFALGEFYTRHAQFSQASEAFAAIHNSSPVLIYAFDSMIKSLIREKKHSEAKMAIDTFRTPHVFETPLTSASNLATARLFSAQGQLVEAIAIAKSEAYNKKQRRAEALLIIYAAASKLKDHAMLEAATLDLVTEASKSLSIGIQIADEATLNCYHDLAQHVLQELKATSGGQIAIVNRLAESYLNGNADSAMNAIAEFKSVLAFAPGNSRAKLGLVNAYQKVRDFESAKVLLAELVHQMPNHIDARRQFARLANARVGKKAGELLYAELQSELPENDLKGSPESIHGHVYSLNTNIGSSQLHEAVALERQAKYMKDWRPSDSISHYETLVQTEPGNLDAFFDLGQQYALKHRTVNAMNVYDRMLHIDPCNQDALTAKVGLGRSIQPLVEFNFISIDQEGRVGLAEIKKLAFDWSYTIPFGDENEYYGFSYSHLVLDPNDDPSLLGNAVGAFIQGRFWDGCSYYFGELDVEIYDSATRLHPNGRFKNRPVFDVGIGFELPMDINLELGGFLENVKENGETLRQDIYMGGGKIRAFWNPLPRWFIDGRWRFIEYSDENIRNDLMIENQLRLLSPPYELNFNFDYEFLAFSNQTIFSPGPGVVGTRHPYFAPGGFSLIGLGFEYKHWLSRDYFKGANHSWMSMEYTPQWDSLNEFYMMAKFGVHHQHGDNLTFGADFKITRSSVYDNDIATSYLKWYF